MAMIGYVVQLANQTISFVASLCNPEAAKIIHGTSFYLYDIYMHSLQYFICIMSFSIALSAMHGYVWYRVARLLTKLNLQDPFSRYVARTLEEMDAVVRMWIVSLIIVYVISQVFKRGIEIQKEN